MATARAHAYPRTLSLARMPCLCCSLPGGVQQEDLSDESGAAITSLGTVVFEKAATFKDTIDVSCDPTCGQCQTKLLAGACKPPLLQQTPMKAIVAQSVLSIANRIVEGFYRRVPPRMKSITPISSMMYRRQGSRDEFDGQRSYENFRGRPIGGD